MDIKSELRKIKLPSAKWTLQTFLDSARLIHGDQYDYSNISEDDISNNQSRVSIFCKQCKNASTPVISNHLRGKKCHVCWENEKRWTLDKFLISACKIHGDKFDYSNISKEDIRNSKSYVNISCKMCGYNWKVQIHGHIVLKSSCPSCTNHIPWTLKRFTDKSMLVHGKDKWDYSLITKDDILKSDERVYLICKTCKNISNPFVTSHIQGGGCGFCFRQRKNWTLKNF